MNAILRPAVLLMNRLSVQQKLFAVAAAMLMAVVVCASLLMLRIESDLGFSVKETYATSLILPARQLMQGVQEHRGVSQAVILGNSAMQSRFSEIDARVREALKRGSNAVSEAGAIVSVAPDWQAISRDAERMLEQGARQTPEESMKTHNELVKRIADYISRCADDTNATLDPELDSYSLMDIFSVQGPNAVEFMGQARARGTTVATRRASVEDDRTRMTVYMALTQRAMDTLQSDAAKAGGANPALKAELDRQAGEVTAAFTKFNNLLRNELQQVKPNLDPARVFDEGTSSINATYGMIDLAARLFDTRIEARIERLKGERTIALGAIVLALLLSGYMLLAVRRGVTGSVNTLRAACERLSNGQVDQACEVRTQDEFGVIAQSLEHVRLVLNDVVRSQKAITLEHDKGQIDYRIDAQAFAGAYREMAELTNQLAHSHIEVNQRFVDTLRHYAEGDFSVSMPELPGQKRQITDAANDIKVKLLALSEVINRLADAAANGDFTPRGDESQFANGYHAMVVSLNRLMNTASAGLGDIARVIGAMSRGDLTERVTADYAGTFGELKNDVNTMADQMHDVVSRIVEASQSVNTAAQEIASGNSDLSSRTEEQAGSLEETAASMEELNATVKQNAENAQQARTLTASSSDVAARGGEMMRKVVDTMGAIQESSRKISDIIGVIDSIAFQTNILALNAAVEAARAGEQGRGFAVVASEVRNLAQRSAQAAKEIKTLIASSVTTVDSGARLVQDTGHTMEDLVQSVQRVSSLVTDISVASREQADGIEQISSAVGQMDEVTQQNAALVEEAAAAAESLEEQARALQETVSQFRLSAATPAATRAAAKSSAATAARPAARKAATAQIAAKLDDEWTEF